MKNKTVVAVLGSGSIGMRHLSLLKQMEGVCPVAVPIRKEKQASLQALGFVTASDLKQAVKEGASRCVLATDTARHVEDGLAALDLGLDVLVEKPLSANAQSAYSLWKEAEEKGRKVFVGCVLRFSESLNTFKSLLNTIGSLHSVRIECQSYLPDWRKERPYKESYSARRGEGGVLLDLIHEIDYAAWLYGRPGRLQADLINYGRLNIDVEETAELSWRTPKGTFVSVGLDYLSRISRRGMRAAGENGSLEWDALQNKVVLECAGEGKQVITSAQTRDEMFLSQLEAFINSDVASESVAPATAEEGVNTLAICDAARISAKSRREEKVEYLQPNASFSTKRKS